MLSWKRFPIFCCLKPFLKHNLVKWFYTHSVYKIRPYYSNTKNGGSAGRYAKPWQTPFLSIWKISLPLSEKLIRHLFIYLLGGGEYDEANLFHRLQFPAYRMAAFSVQMVDIPHAKHLSDHTPDVIYCFLCLMNTEYKLLVQDLVTLCDPNSTIKW